MFNLNLSMHDMVELKRAISFRIYWLKGLKFESMVETEKRVIEIKELEDLLGRIKDEENMR